MKSVALHNLGSKVNAYELEYMQQTLQEKGYKIVPFDEAADIYIVNTCTVTNIADRKSRQMLHRAKKRNPEAVVVAVGCYVQTGKETLETDGTVDLAIGNNRKKDLVEILENYLEQRQTQPVFDCIDISQTSMYEEVTLKRTAEHTRAYIKIQDGCNQFCSYCIIPYARGRVRSRKPEKVIEEVKKIAQKGIKEVVITGIHIASYGKDFKEEYKLIDLLEEMNQIEGIQRIRLGSIEPLLITEEFLVRLSKLEKICHHFHLSLQSGCNETLKRMNRRYTTQDFEEIVMRLRKTYKDVILTTDIIVGFPRRKPKRI